jgi:hypothetical protein
MMGEMMRFQVLTVATAKKMGILKQRNVYVILHI